ncbi:DUF4157 domain-containing protein [Nostoc sp. FACHB-152]|uniref:eCIS core domain-containing protein n=1 Tax=unclassified Nostoc TaxID=2593658 RepID=UPI001689029E|nr:MULTISPECIES: DUF4157 domain-containing protein [unclassified Nostoc]MBD2449267.1 DUF4157 domain-containing protein [Nostoc sp. FACHB-152]MBD2470455.1 DUF4157 domain-containing protein [Nostoc sp. FACHB-145]
MRERIAQRKKTTSSVSIPTLKQPTRGFGLESLNASPPAVTEVQPMNKPLGHDISRIALHHPQAKLTIGQPGDFYEQQADSVARQVMQRIAQSGNRQSIQRQQAPEEEELQMKPLEINTLQRQQAPEEEEELQMKSLDSSILQRQEVPQEEEELQMKPLVQRQGGGAMAATSDLETSINQARGGGHLLGNDIREPMEQAFGADFSGVKVHTDTQSDQLNKSIQARAFTTGQDVFFRQGEYNPGSRGGQELLAHELTHVVQQNGGAVQQSLFRASLGKTLRKSGAASVISDLFRQQHMGNFKKAQDIAQERAGTIPGACHVISIDELSSIRSEINNRETNGYHAVAANRVVNPSTGNNQFLTDNSYKIFEFSYDGKNRVKKGKTINNHFYYDAIPNGAGGFILHHFDGIA